MDPWWVQQGYPDFGEGTGMNKGFPHPGEVIKHYRQQQTQWIRPDGSIGRCRLEDVADALNVNESWVRHMEKYGNVDIGKRRFFMQAFGIPGTLLGLAALSDITTNGTRTLDSETLGFYTSSLEDSWQRYYTGATQNLLGSLGQKTVYLNHIITDVTPKQQPFIQSLIAQLLLLTARVGSDQNNTGVALDAIKKSQKVAKHLHDPELEASTYFWSGRMLLENGHFLSAQNELRKALALIPQVHNSHLIAGIYLESGLAGAYTAKGKQDRVQVRNLFDLAEKSMPTTETDIHHIKVNPGRHLQFLSEAYIAMNQPDDALDTLDRAWAKTAPDMTRRRTYIDILRGDAYTKKREYDTAVTTLETALADCIQIGSGVNIAFIGEIAKHIEKTTYKKSTNFIRLQRQLQQAM